MKTAQEYEEGFEKSLKLKFKGWSFKGKQELKILLDTNGFHRKKIKGEVQVVPVTQKQIDFAWDFYKKQLVQQELTVAKIFCIHLYGKRTVYRATRGQEINGRYYKRGQFIPKRE